MSRLRFGSTGVRVLMLAGLVLFFAGEMIARRLTAVEPSFAYQFQSSILYQVDPSGAVRYIPNHDFRVVVVHNDTLEYDERYHTNNHGFVDSRDYPTLAPGAGGRRYVFVGDAFVAGIGARPWVPQLRDALQGAGRAVDLYNFGVGGTSVQHFATLLRSMSRELAFTDVVLLPGSNNFLRPHWVPVVTGSEIRFCRPDGVETCIRRRQPFLMAAFDESWEQIRARTRERTRLAQVDTTPVPAWKRVARQSVLAREVRDQVRRTYHRLYPPPYDPFDMEDARELPDSLQALTDMRSEFPGIPIHLVHFPQKDEIASRQYKLDVREKVEEIGISYFPALTACRWTSDMYFPNDGHPSALGYQNMSTCVAKYLSLQ